MMRLSILMAVALAVGVSFDNPDTDFYRLGKIVGAVVGAMFLLWVIELVISSTKAPVRKDGQLQ